MVSGCFMVQVWSIPSSCLASSSRLCTLASWDGNGGRLEPWARKSQPFEKSCPRTKQTKHVKLSQIQDLFSLWWNEIVLAFLQCDQEEDPEKESSATKSLKAEISRLDAERKELVQGGSWAAADFLRIGFEWKKDVHVYDRKRCIITDSMVPRHDFNRLNMQD